jgi:hypothetical protein
LLVDVSIQVLTAFANPPALPLSEAQIAAKVRRLLADFGRPVIPG